MYQITDLFVHIKQNNYPLIRFFFYSGEDKAISSLTIASQDLLDYSYITAPLSLVPDLETGFTHPTSLQITYCLLASQLKDERTTIARDKGLFLTSINFSFDGIEADNWQDLRSEILLEGQKAGLKLLNHRSDGQIITIDLLAFSPLHLADSLEKFKIISKAIAISYAQSINWEPLDKNLIIRSKKFIAKPSYDDLYKNESYDILYAKSLDCNCYKMIKDLCGHYYYSY